MMVIRGRPSSRLGIARGCRTPRITKKRPVSTLSPNLLARRLPKLLLRPLLLYRLEASSQQPPTGEAEHEQARIIRALSNNDYNLQKLLWHKVHEVCWPNATGATKWMFTPLSVACLRLATHEVFVVNVGQLRTNLEYPRCRHSYIHTLILSRFAVSYLLSNTDQKD